uniref:Uncharacterized protein n=1 Tax=Oryza brachyantha TaxID=4533 RepID=J3LAL6_ORYBR
MGWRSLSTSVAVVMSAERMAAGLQSGRSVRSRPTMPATCGHDMEVPDSELKATRRLSKARSVGELARVHAATTLTPGAVMSGFRIPGVTVFGPFDENDAMNGAGFAPSLVSGLVIVPDGFLKRTTTPPPSANHGRRRRAKTNGATEIPLLGFLEVGEDALAVAELDVGGREDVRVGDDLVAGGGVVGEHHPGAAGFPHRLALLHPRVHSTQAHHDLPLHLRRIKRTKHAKPPAPLITPLITR